MARNRQPILKRARALGFTAGDMGYSKESKRNPGSQRRAKKSEYALQLKEKQKVKFVDGILEKQFHKYYEKAANQKGNTGDNMLVLIERRLDNVAYRLNFGKTRRMARQMVSHGHILVDGKCVNIPSCEIKVGQVISLKEKARKSSQFKDTFLGDNKAALPYLERNENDFSGKLISLPERKDIPVQINDQMVVEYYSK